jgi:hypothetical protein
MYRVGEVLVDIFAQRIKMAALLIGCFELFDSGLGFWGDGIWRRLSRGGGSSMAGVVMAVAVGER